MAVALNAASAVSGLGRPSYGGMFENGAGSTITVVTAGTYYGWTTASAGTVAGAGYVTFTGDATADRLTIGADGAWVYYCVLCLCYSGTANSTAVCSVFKDGVEQTNVSLRRKLGTGGDVGSTAACGILTLAAGNYLDVRVTADGNGDTVVVQRCNLTIVRIA